MRDAPLYLLAATVWAYWVGACLKIARVGRRERKAACFVPAEPLERLLWPVWFVLIISWIALPALAVFRPPYLLVDESLFRRPAFSALRWGASLAAVLCLAGTIECWARMGESWRMAVTPGQKSELITTGLYSRIRHPIYALSILLMICSAVILPSFPMVAVAALHITFMVLKARNEERHLLRAHGERYSRYSERTGRFLPRLFA
jgi:protein-S-isoprenylcysteine O-methyltransferase Ste14